MPRFRSAAVAAALLLGFSTVAIAQGSSRDSARAERVKRGGHGRMGRALFRGITLTDAQKTRLESLRESHKTQARTLREQLRPQMQALRDARQKNDTVAMRTSRSQLMQKREQLMALADRRRVEVRSILTPEQQSTFDKNSTELRDRSKFRRQHRRHHRRGA
jgi:Spy/CpxP family protein refolding chaperone